MSKTLEDYRNVAVDVMVGIQTLLVSEPGLELDTTQRLQLSTAKLICQQVSMGTIPLTGVPEGEPNGCE